MCNACNQWQQGKQCKQSISSLGTGGATKSDEFSEQFQTAFDPPSFSENYIAFFSENVRKKGLYKGPKPVL